MRNRARPLPAGSFLKGRGVALLGAGERRVHTGGAAERCKRGRGTGGRERDRRWRRRGPARPQKRGGSACGPPSSLGRSWRSEGPQREESRGRVTAPCSDFKNSHENSHFGRLLRGREGLVDGVRLLELGLIGDLEEGVPTRTLVKHEHGCRFRFRDKMDLRNYFYKPFSKNSFVRQPSYHAAHLTPQPRSRAPERRLVRAPPRRHVHFPIFVSDVALLVADCVQLKPPPERYFAGG